MDLYNIESRQGAVTAVERGFFYLRFSGEEEYAINWGEFLLGTICVSLFALIDSVRTTVSIPWADCLPNVNSGKIACAVAAGEVITDKHLIFFTEDLVMAKVKSKLLVVCVAVILLGVLAVSPASAVTILYQGWGVDIYLGKPFNSLEFEDPTAVGKWVQSYRVLDWRDADYQYFPRIPPLRITGTMSGPYLLPVQSMETLMRYGCATPAT